MYMQLCVYTYIPKYNLLGQYNVIIGMFSGLTICVFDSHLCFPGEDFSHAQHSLPGL